MLSADSRTSTDECFGPIEHGFCAGEWVVAEDQTGERVCGRQLPMSRKSFVRFLLLPQS